MGRQINRIFHNTMSIGVIRKVGLAGNGINDHTHQLEIRQRGSVAYVHCEAKLVSHTTKELYGGEKESGVLSHAVVLEYPEAFWDRCDTRPRPHLVRFRNSPWRKPRPQQSGGLAAAAVLAT